ncbi:MAG: hypothetical protein WD971_12210, partial [Pirellulales bacterium]
MIVIALAAITRTASSEPNSAFGKRQLAQVLHDRPKMNGIFNEDDIVYKWTVEHFESGYYRHQICWDAREPFTGRPAENQPAHKLSSAVVRVSNSGSISGRDEWHCRAFFGDGAQHGTA